MMGILPASMSLFHAVMGVFRLFLEKKGVSVGRLCFVLC